MKPFLYEGTYVCYPMISIVETNRSIRNETLQHIVLFDMAESEMGLGQVNFRKTSSFCERGNFVNGINYKPPLIGNEHLYDRSDIRIFNYAEWDKINKKIIKGNITPGAHICCAGEWKFGVAGDNIYAGIGIAIPDDNTNAILFMECVGKSISITNDIIREDIIESIKRIGENQGIRYKEIHVVTDERTIKNDLGCAMVAIPYFLKE